MYLVKKDAAATRCNLVSVCQPESTTERTGRTDGTDGDNNNARTHKKRMKIVVLLFVILSASRQRVYVHSLEESIL